MQYLLPTPGIPPGSVPLINCSTQDTVAPNLVTPYVQTWSMGIQRELSRNMMFEVNYVGTKGTKLYQRARSESLMADGTRPAWQPESAPYCLNPRLNPNRGDITQVTNAGLSTYNGLQASMNTRTFQLHGNSLTFTAAYTWSHMIDTASEIFGPGLRFVQYEFCRIDGALSPNGLSNIEAITPFPQIYNELGGRSGETPPMIAATVWCSAKSGGCPHSPNFTRAAKAVLGGWYLNGIGTVQSGQPFTPLNGTPQGPCADATRRRKPHQRPSQYRQSLRPLEQRGPSR